MQGLKIALDFGQKCKKDGLLEWQRGNAEEAIASWRQGDETLKRFRAPAKNVDENMLIIEMHSAVLKNLAQAAIKLELWSEALEAADRVLDMNKDDHKAWFRRACALEGLGRLDEARDCLARIEELSVGRNDRERLAHDCKAKRDRYQALEEQYATDQRRMLQRGIERGVFSTDRIADRPAAPIGPKRKTPLLHAAPSAAAIGSGEASPAGTAQSSEKAQVRASPSQIINNPNRKRLTKEGAWDLLDDLDAAYRDPWFVQRIDKLIADVRFSTREFMQNLGRVALEAQKPVLEKWGFEPSGSGVLEMRAALQDHTRGPRGAPSPSEGTEMAASSAGGDVALRERAEAVNRRLYGSPELKMYERVVGGA